MHQIEQSLCGASSSIIIVLDTVTHYSSVGTVVTVSEFDKSKPVYYQWLHQPLYNKTQDTNCWYQLTSRPALNRTKPVNLLQRHKNTWEPVKYQSHFVLLLVIFYWIFFHQESVWVFVSPDENQWNLPGELLYCHWLHMSPQYANISMVR